MKYELALLLLGTCLMFSGCGTVSPKPIESDEASWDSNRQDSGLIAYLPDGSALITSHARDRYNELIQRYGQQFNPKLTADEGVRPGPVFDRGATYLMDQEHLVKFMMMNQWRKANRKPN